MFRRTILPPPSAPKTVPAPTMTNARLASYLEDRRISLEAVFAILATEVA
jgi:hypothetical protein